MIFHTCGLQQCHCCMGIWASDNPCLNMHENMLSLRNITLMIPAFTNAWQHWVNCHHRKCKKSCLACANKASGPCSLSNLEVDVSSPLSPTSQVDGVSDELHELSLEEESSSLVLVSESDTVSSTVTTVTASKLPSAHKPGTDSTNHKCKYK